MTPTRWMFAALLAAALAGLAAGCGDRGSTPAPESAPLTLDAWKALAPPGKYDIDALERLKQGEPKLQDERAWQKFSRDVLLPAKKKDGVAVPRS